MERRRELLHEYLREVARELLHRGAVVRQNGMSLMEVLHKQPSAMVGFIMRDLKEAGFSVGNELVGGAIGGFMQAIFGGRRG